MGKRLNPVMVIASALAVAIALILIIFVNYNITTLYDNKDISLVISGASFMALVVVFLLSVLSGRVKVGRTMADIGILLGISSILIAAGNFAAPALKDISSLAIKILFPIISCCLTSIVYCSRRKRFSDTVSANSVRRSAVGQGIVKYALAVLFASTFILLAVGVYYSIAGGAIFLCLPAAALLSCLLIWAFFKWRLLWVIADTLFVFVAASVIVATIVSGIPDVCMAVVTVMLFTLIGISLSDVYCNIK